MPQQTEGGSGFGANLARAHQAAQNRISRNNKIVKQLMEADGPSGAPSVMPSGATSGVAKIPHTSGNLIKTLQAAGFKGEELRKAWAVAMRESGGRANAYNGNANTGDRSYGLFQINMLGSLGPARMKQFGLSSERDLLDPLVNARAAYQMSRGGWSAWDIDQSGYNYNRNRASWKKHYDAYMKYYNAFPSALSQARLTSAAAARISK